MPYVGNVESLKWTYDEEEAREKGSPRCIDTPRLEVRAIVLPPGAYPPYHAHHEEMDEGYLIWRGSGLIHSDGAAFDVGEGDVLLNPRGAMHHMKNTGRGELVEFNFRGGRMPSGFLLPEGEPPPNPDPESVENRLSPPVPCVKGSVDALAAPFDPERAREKGLRRAFSTEYLECQVVSFPPGAKPRVHRHQREMDEATLVLEGRMNFIVEEETIEASAGDLVHVPGGVWHTVHNAGGAPAALFNFRGGALPSRTEWRGE